MIPVTARLANPLCGDVSFSTTEWDGSIRGASTKVIFFFICRLSIFKFILQFCSSFNNLGIFCCYYWPKWKIRSRPDG